MMGFWKFLRPIDEKFLPKVIKVEVEQTRKGVAKKQPKEKWL
jgi:hypothetical protein